MAYHDSAGVWGWEDAGNDEMTALQIQRCLLDWTGLRPQRAPRVQAGPTAHMGVREEAQQRMRDWCVVAVYSYDLR